ncbi:MAG TPA: hypothetical protein VHP14_01330 [Anaerolineales bacterium]|nr:hypothetical protein [Anaerolineales bacterium]
MSSFQLPNEEEIREAYRQGEAVVIVLFQTTMMALAERIQSWKTNSPILKYRE